MTGFEDALKMVSQWDFPKGEPIPLTFLIEVSYLAA
jgi:hypothetical protein